MGEVRELVYKFSHINFNILWNYFMLDWISYKMEKENLHKIVAIELWIRYIIAGKQQKLNSCILLKHEWANNMAVLLYNEASWELCSHVSN